MARDLTPLSPFNSLFSHSRVLTMEWIQGVKLTTLAPDEINDLVKVGQEAFLIQLLEVRAEEVRRAAGSAAIKMYAGPQRAHQAHHRQRHPVAGD